MNNFEIFNKAEMLLNNCRKAGVTIAAVESCTGGALLASLTEVPGSSDVVERGFVTYTNEAKHELVDVPKVFISKFGAVSKQVAIAMAQGGLEHSSADIAVGITGVAGPGQSEQKPAGLVHISAERRDGHNLHEECNFTGSRTDIRNASIVKAFRMITMLL